MFKKYSVITCVKIITTLSNDEVFKTVNLHREQQKQLKIGKGILTSISQFDDACFDIYL